jgi:N utilization substance protein A
MPKSDIITAIEQVCDEKNIPFDSVVEAVEAALAVAYRKEFGNKMLNCRVEFNPEDASSRIFDVKTVVADPTEEDLDRLKKAEEKSEKEKREGKDRREEKREEQKPAVEGEEEEHRYNPRTDMGVTEAKKIKPDAELGDEMITELPVPEGYGRVAAQTAKQVIIQKLREAERETLFNQYKDRVGEIVNATVQRVEGPMVFMDLGHATALMPPAQQNPRERYKIGDRYKVYLLSVEQGRRGPEIVASRTAPEMVKTLFAMEVPELTNGAIEIKAVAREAGSRSKIAVHSMADNIDPIGSCVGQRGARVQTVMNELGGEKIDIIEYSDDAVRFIVNALSPAKVVSVKLKEADKIAQAFVAEDQLSLAIGKGGQNVRLAAKLSGWKIDVVKDDTPVESAEGEEKEEEAPATEPEKATEPDAPAEAPETKKE